MNEDDSGYVKSLVYILLRLVDEGYTCSVDEATRHIREGDFFDWLRTFDSPYGIGFFDAEVGPRVREALERYLSGIHRSKIGISRSGFLYVALLATELLGEYMRDDEQE